MSPPRFASSAEIAAPAASVYSFLADYREGHPAILPHPPFVSLDVEEGGVGAGTVIWVRMRVLGRVDGFRAVVSEPEPGRVLVETNDTGYVTSFTVDPLGPDRSRVTIATEQTREGWRARAEAWLVARRMLPVYRRELGLLAELAGGAAA